MYGVSQPPPPALRRLCGCFMVGNSAAAAICAISGMTTLRIKCNKADWKRRGERNRMRKPKRASPSGRPFRGKEGGAGHCPRVFTQTVRRECHTHSHKPQSKSLTPQPLEVCCLFSQERLRRAQIYVFHTHACSRCT